MEKTVLIVSRTKMKNGVCVGGIVEDTGELIRLHNERGGNLASDAPYEVGDRWQLLVEEAWNRRDEPHVEDRATTPIARLGKVGNAGIIDYLTSHDLGNRFTHGRLRDTFEGCLQSENCKYFIGMDKVSSFSTQFWFTDSELVLKSDPQSGKIYYSDGVYKIPHVGFQDCVGRIPKDTVIRLSLANPTDWEGRYNPKRCYLQLSGWYL